MGSNKKATIAIYRALIRFTKRPLVRDTSFVLPISSLSTPLLPYLPGPFIRDAEGIRTTVARAFRIGSHLPPSTKEAGEALDLAFLFLRELVDFCPILNSLNERRADHLDREGIRFCIGQVCQHKKFGYRGIVFQWDHRPVSDAVSTFEGVIGTPRGSNQPFYHILPDFNDAIAFFGGVRDVRYVCEDNLEPVVEPYFNRVYSPHASEIFQAPAVFCPEGGVFLPSRQLSYVYPSDVSALEAVATYSVEEMQELAKRPTYDGKYLSQWASEILSDVLVKVQQERVWEECEAGRGGGGGFDAETDSTLSALEEAWGHFPWSFYSLSLGKGVSENSIQSSITQSSSSYGSNSSDWFRNMLPGISPCRAVRNELLRVIKEAEESSVQWNRGYHAAAALVGFYNGLQGLLQRRKTSMRDGAHVEFQIGDVVRHHSWGYRAVIASFDCRPNLDSMHWDGVTDLKNGPVQPFYTLLPDLHDVKEALGEPHPTLYIAQESLERTTGGLVRSPLLKLFFSNYSTSLNRFMPLEGMRFRFPSPSYYTGTTTSQEGLGGEPNRHCRTALALERIVSDIRLKLQSCEKKGQLVGSLENLLQGARSKWEADTVDILQRKLSESKLDSSVQQAWRNIEVLSSHRQYQYVIAELHELLRTDPEGDLAALIHQKLAHLYLKSGDYGRSIESAGYVLDSEPSQRNRIDCLTVRGQALLKLDQLLEAEDDLRDAIAYNPWGVAPSALLAAQAALRKQKHKRKSIKKIVVSQQQHSSCDNSKEEQTDQ